MERSEKDKLCLTKIMTPLACWIIRRKNARSGVSAIRSQTRKFRYLSVGRRVQVGFLDTDKTYRMRRDRVYYLSAPGSKTSGILLKNPERVKWGRGSKRYKKTAVNMWGWVECRERRYEVGGRRIGGLKARVEWER